MDSSPQPQPQIDDTLSCSALLNIFWFIVMVSSIGLGAAHLDQCPVQPYIPIYLLVLGLASPISLTLTFIRSHYDNGWIHILSTTFLSLLHLFNFCWLIAGSVWVYPIYRPNYLRGDRYCQKTTYEFAFVVTTIVWSIAGLVFLCGCGCSLITGCETFRARLIPNRISFYGATTEEPRAGDV